MPGDSAPPIEWAASTTGPGRTAAMSDDGLLDGCVGRDQAQVVGVCTPTQDVEGLGGRRQLVLDGPPHTGGVSRPVDQYDRGRSPGEHASVVATLLITVRVDDLAPFSSTSHR